jgi:DNA polymerase elongation subunit (family B)
MRIISIDILGYEDTVYDVETTAGTFLAGSLETGIMVKNTDSCYVTFPINKSDYATEEQFMIEQFKTAKSCAKTCSDAFKQPMELEFEKFMYPLFLSAKKRYAYKEWVDPAHAEDELQYKGLQLVRRDTCRYVKEELSNIFEIILNEKSREDGYNASINYVKNSIKNLLDGNIDPNKLVLSKQLKARYKVRKNNKTTECNWKEGDIQLPHVRVAQELRLINPANSLKPPDRVPFLFIEKKNTVLQCDKVIHPGDFNNSQKIDSLYYFDRQYKKPIHMIFDIMTSAKETTELYSRMVIKKTNESNNQREITDFFGSKKEKKEAVEFIWNPELTEELTGED